MSDAGGGIWVPPGARGVAGAGGAPGSPGPEAGIGGRRATTFDPGSPLDLPASLQTLNRTLASIEGVLTSLEARIAEEKMVMDHMLGKEDQTRRSGFGGPASVHTRGRASVPRITVRHPGGEMTEEEFPPEGRVQTMSGVRQRAAKRVSESNAFGPRIMYRKDEQGRSILHRRTGIDDKGQDVYERVPEEEVGSTLRNARIGGAVQGALGRIVSGEGGLSSLGGIGSALIPEAMAGPLGIGLAAGAIGYEGIQMVQNQRAQNAQYQAILGGSNFSQFGQRASEFGFRMRNLGVLSSGQAEQAFMGTTGMGMRGEERNAAITMAVNTYKDLGMSISQSLEAVNVQAKSGYENFSALEDSLSKVSKAAKDTAQNAEAVRESFINTYSTLTQSVGGGAATLGTATSISQMQTGLGRQFANVNFGGITGQNQMYMMAAQAGMSYNQFVGNSLGNTSFLPGQINRLQNRILGAAGTQAQAAIKTALSSRQFASPTGKLSSSQIQDLTTQLLQNGQLPPIPMLQQQLQLLGIDTSNMSPQQIAEYYVAQQAGQTQLNTNNPAGIRHINEQQRKALQAGVAGVQGANDVNQDAGIGALGAAAKKAGIDVGTIDISKGNRSNDLLRQGYLRQVARTGQNSGLVDQMLRQAGTWGKNLYTVQTAQGAKTVNFHDLITNYADQAATGAVTVAEGKDAQGNSIAGTQLGQSFGITPDAQAQFKTASAKQNLKGKDRSGQVRSDEDKGKQKVVIGFTPQAQAWLQQVTGGQPGTAAATSLTPTLGPVEPDSMPGAAYQNPTPGT